MEWAHLWHLNAWCNCFWNWCFENWLALPAEETVWACRICQRFLAWPGNKVAWVYLDPPFYFGESGPEQQTEGTCTHNAYNAHLPACSGMPLFIFPTVPHLRRGKTVVSIIRSIIGRWITPGRLSLAVVTKCQLLRNCVWRCHTCTVHIHIPVHKHCF